MCGKSRATDFDAERLWICYTDETGIYWILVNGGGVPVGGRFTINTSN